MGVLSLIPLLILFAFIGAFAWFGYQIYLYSLEMAQQGKKHMEKGPIVFTKDGMKVNVKDVSREDYEDSTQSVLVKTWNLANESKSGGSRASSRTRPINSRQNSGVTTGRS